MKGIDLQTFLATIMAVSVAVERAIEILKQTLGTLPFIKWLFTQNNDPVQDSWRCAVIHIISALAGGVIAAYSGIKVLNFDFDKCPEYKYLNDVLVGLLSAGGSAFWNHALDLVKAAKVQKEETAKVTVAATVADASANAIHL